MNAIYKEDMETIASNSIIEWEKLNGSTVLVTGATGLIGSNLVNALLYANETRGYDITIIALVRDIDKARTRFGDEAQNGGKLVLACGDVENLPQFEHGIDYIVHSASPTASAYFADHPVETIKASVLGTLNMLQLGVERHVKGFLYISSMEVYGQPEKRQPIKESFTGALPPQNARNSYPLAKQLSECLCTAYVKEHALPVTTVRLAQTFGPGVASGDKRVFAEFAHCVKAKHNIVLKSKGGTERSYLYTADAVAAILILLTKGARAEAYNAANRDTYCSIKQMAELVAEIGGVSVEYDLTDAEKMGYAPELYMDLDTTKLENLGWRPTRSLKEMYERMIACMV